MSKALWPAVSGAVARDQEVETISNNLANANTNGFKKDGVDFKQYLVKEQKEGDLAEDIPRSPIKDKDLYPLEGRDQAFVIVNGTHTNFKTGGIKVTDNPLDLALNGPGFFEVSTPKGIRYTKAGSFKMANDGKLVTTDGNPVLASGEGDPSGRQINLSDRQGSVHINSLGEIYMNDELVSKISVVEFKDTHTIRKNGGLLFENKDPTGNLPMASENTEVKQGMVETSNVNPVEEISNLIRANRMFEEDLKSIKTVNEMLSKEVNEVGKMQ
jgi:flagellar basal-body rod protein FlgF